MQLQAYVSDSDLCIDNRQRLLSFRATVNLRIQLPSIFLKILSEFLIFLLISKSAFYIFSIRYSLSKNCIVYVYVV
jgi:hypothetical protein